MTIGSFLIIHHKKILTRKSVTKMGVGVYHQSGGGCCPVYYNVVLVEKEEVRLDELHNYRYQISSYRQKIASF